MTKNSALVTALDLATQQLEAARSGRFDHVMALLGDYEQACSAAVSAIAPGDEMWLRQLIAANARIGTMVAIAATDARDHLHQLHDKRSLNSAYRAGSIPSALTADISA